MIRSSKIVRFIAILTVLFAALFTSCGGAPTYKKVESHQPIERLYIKYHESGDNSARAAMVTVLTYEHAGHRYQFHKIGDGPYAVGGPVHDPDCGCLDF